MCTSIYLGVRVDNIKDFVNAILDFSAGVKPLVFMKAAQSILCYVGVGKALELPDHAVKGPKSVKTDKLVPGRGAEVIDKLLGRISLIKAVDPPEFTWRRLFELAD